MLRGLLGRHALWSDTEPRKRVLISHSTEDRNFAERLCLDFQGIGVRCLLSCDGEVIINSGNDPRDIEDAFKKNYRIILILSEHSTQTAWLAAVVNEVLREEKKQLPKRKKKLLFPVSLDSRSDQWTLTFRDVRRQVADFDGWLDNESYDKAFNVLRQSIG